MNGYLLDTNVVSELRKGSRADPGVRAWFEDQDDRQLYLSVLTLGEIRRGVLKIANRDPRQAQALDRWLDRVREAWGTRLLPVDAAVTSIWAELMTPEPRSVIDALLGATALRHDLTLVTRNVADLEGAGVELLNPFSCAAPYSGSLPDSLPIR